MIYLRHRYTNQPQYAHDFAAWLTRPDLTGPNPTTAIEDDASSGRAPLAAVLELDWTGDALPPARCARWRSPSCARSRLSQRGIRWS